MHSSRMRTGRSLTVCCSLLPGGGFCLVWGVSAWSKGGVCLVWGVCLVLGGFSLQGGFSLPGGWGDSPCPGGGLPGDPPC